jgi:hypothetical protein
MDAPKGLDKDMPGMQVDQYQKPQKEVEKGENAHPLWWQMEEEVWAFQLWTTGCTQSDVGRFLLLLRLLAT